MKEMLMAYDKYRKDFEAYDGKSVNFINARFYQLIGMLMMMQECKVITENEYHVEMLDLQEIRDDLKGDLK